MARSIPDPRRSGEGYAAELKTSPSALQARLDWSAPDFAPPGSHRPHPSLDDKVLASWNGLMLRSLALAYDVTGESVTAPKRSAPPTFCSPPCARVPAPQRAAAACISRGRTEPQSFLDDYGFVVAGLLDLHAATSDARWLDASNPSRSGW